MTYFVDPYTKYYEKLNGASSMTSAASGVISGLNESKSIISNVNTSLAGSNWSELGLDQISDNIFPSMVDFNQKLISNAENVIKAAVDKALGSLLPEVTSLKAEDEHLDQLKSELDSLVVVPRTDADGNETAEYRAYISKKTELERQIEESKRKCEEYKANSDAYAAEIMSLDDLLDSTEFNMADFSGSTTSTLDDSAAIAGSVEGGKMIKITFRGHEFYVANTRVSVLDYEAYLQKNGQYQNAGFMDGWCPLLSQSYACDMMRGTYTRRDTDAVMKGQRPSGRMNSGISSESYDEVMEYMYNELTAGRVGTLRVSRKSGNGTHVVTVVGFDSSVKSYKDLNEDTILVLDCVDGKIQTLSQARSEGGHERKIVKVSSNNKSVYVFHSATQDFISKEVENPDWQAKHGQGNTTVAA